MCNLVTAVMKLKNDVRTQVSTQHTTPSHTHAGAHLSNFFEPDRLVIVFLTPSSISFNWVRPLQRACGSWGMGGTWMGVNRYIPNYVYTTHDFKATHTHTHLYLKVDPLLKNTLVLLILLSALMVRKKQWCSTHDFHRSLHALREWTWKMTDSS